MVSLINAKSSSSFSGKPAITVDVSFLYAVSTSILSLRRKQTRSMRVVRVLHETLAAKARNLRRSNQLRLLLPRQLNLEYPLSSVCHRATACLKKSSTSAHFPVLYVHQFLLRTPFDYLGTANRISQVLNLDAVSQEPLRLLIHHSRTRPHRTVQKFHVFVQNNLFRFRGHARGVPGCRGG